MQVSKKETTVAEVFEAMAGNPNKIAHLKSIIQKLLPLAEDAIVMYIDKGIHPDEIHEDQIILSQAREAIL